MGPRTCGFKCILCSMASIVLAVSILLACLVASSELIGRLSDVQLSQDDRRLQITFESVHEAELELKLRARSKSRFVMSKVTDQETAASVVSEDNQVQAQLRLENTRIGNWLQKPEPLLYYRLHLSSSRDVGFDDLCWQLSQDQPNGRHRWYGAPALYEQHWPMRADQIVPRAEYMTSGFHPNTLGTVVEYLWLSTSGFLIYADPSSRLFVEQQDGHFCLSLGPADATPATTSTTQTSPVTERESNLVAESSVSTTSAGNASTSTDQVTSLSANLSSSSTANLSSSSFSSPSSPPSSSLPSSADESTVEGAPTTTTTFTPTTIVGPSETRTMVLNIMIGRNVRHVYEQFQTRFLPRPKRQPDPIIYTRSIWSTWAQFKRDINQSKLIDHAQQIKEHGFVKEGAIFEIDDKWEKEFGTFEFDSDRFPDANEMMRELHAMNFNTSARISPFVNEQVFDRFDSETRNHFIKDAQTGQPLLMRWGNGDKAALVDFTSPAASRWFVKRVQQMMTKYSLDTFKMDAGEIEWAAKTGLQFSTQNHKSCPNCYSREVANAVAAVQNGLAELRTSFAAQSQGNLLQVLDKDSSWSHRNGLRSVIPSCLLYNLFGYSFLIPDMIGGNANDRLDKELFLRWASLNAMLPFIQYSIPPWRFDEETSTIALQLQNKHQQLASLFRRLARHHVDTGEPIIRPVWWLAPEDRDTWELDSEFLVGDEILVAPIVQQGQTRRDVYLPAGRWKDELSYKDYMGPVWLKDYLVPLDKIATFRRLA